MTLECVDSVKRCQNIYEETLYIYGADSLELETVGVIQPQT